MARHGTSLDIGADLEKRKKKEPAIKVEEIDHQEIDKSSQKSLKESHKKPKKLRLEKYGGNSAPDKVLRFLDKRKVLIFLLLCVIVGWWSLQQPLRLENVDSTVEKTFWNDVAKQTSLKLDVDFPLMSTAEKSRLFDREIKQLQNNPEVLHRLNQLSIGAKSLFIDNGGYLYLFNKEAYKTIRSGPVEFLSSSIGPFTSLTHEQFASVLPFLLGIISIILFFFVGNQLGKYAGFFSALLLAMHPTFIKNIHLGKVTAAMWFIPATILILLLVCQLVKKHQSMKTTGFVILFAYLAFAYNYLASNAPSVKELIGSFHIVLVPFALVSFCYILYSLKKYPKKNFQHIALVIGTIIVIIMSAASADMLVVALPFFLLLVAYCLEKALPVCVTALEHTHLGFQEKTWTWTAVVIIGLVIFLGFMPLVKAYTPHPEMNDAIFDTANFIKYQQEMPVISWHTHAQQIGFYSQQETLVNALDESTLLSKALLAKNESAALIYLNQMADKAFLVISLSNLKSLPYMINPDAPESIALSDISKCGYQGRKLICQNGYVLEGTNITQGKPTAEVISYLTGEREKYDGKNTLIIFQNKKVIYSFIIDEEYADTMLVQLIGQKEFESFNLLHREEVPEQIFVYEFTT